jgi:hypothetical protein
MHKKDERAEFFELLVKLLWYLGSGKAHVGYLYNFENNPLKEIV